MMGSTGTQLKNVFVVPIASAHCWVVLFCQSRVRSSAHGPAALARWVEFWIQSHLIVNKEA